MRQDKHKHQSRSIAWLRNMYEASKHNVPWQKNMRLRTAGFTAWLRNSEALKDNVPWQKSMRLRTAGFTLMEILVAMAIVGILAGVGFSAYTVSIQKSHDAQRKNDLEEMAKAIEGYQSDFGVYPASETDRIAGCGNGDTGDSIDATEVCTWGAAWSLDTGKLYIKELPRDPRDQYFYVYKASSDQRKYQLFANLENTKDPRIDFSITYSCSQEGDTCNYGIASPNADINEVLQ